MEDIPVREQIRMATQELENRNRNLVLTLNDLESENNHLKELLQEQETAYLVVLGKMLYIILSEED